MGWISRILMKRKLVAFLATLLLVGSMATAAPASKPGFLHSAYGAGKGVIPKRGHERTDGSSACGRSLGRGSTKQT